MPRHQTRLLALLLVLALAAGCGEDSSDSSGQDATSSEAASPSQEAAATEEAIPTDTGLGSGASDSEACNLVSADEVSQAVGTEVSDGTGTDSPAASGGTQSVCQWSSLDSPKKTAILTIFSDKANAEALHQAFPDAEPLPGVGDDAFIGPASSVVVVVGDRALLTTYGSPEAPGDGESQSIELAKLVAEKL